MDYYLGIDFGTTGVRLIIINNELLSLESFKLVELHTIQLQPIRGTPCEVPVPKNITFIFI